jgi:hypothetical protein
MTLNFKALCLALVAMLTMGVLAASASAAVFHSELSGTTTIEGSQVGTNTIVTDTGTIHCTTATFSGSHSGTTVADYTITPLYTGCKSTGLIEANVTIDVNGCKYTLTSNGIIHITSCTNTNQTIVVTEPFCTIEIGQITIEPVDFINEGTGSSRDIKVTSTITNLAYHESGAACAHSGLNTSGGSYTGSITFKGKDALGFQVGIWRA